MEIMYIILLILCEIISEVFCVPPDYCNFPLNQSDCSMTPKPVFSYYKPGSRCEMKWWRGCQTLNKFDSEAECVHMCISSLIISFDESLVQGFDTPKYCLEKLNTEKCSTEMELVYKYIPEKGYCTLDIWYQCDTSNKFNDQETCYTACTGKPFSDYKNKHNQLENWKAILLNLSKEHLKYTLKIVKNITLENDSKADDDSTKPDKITSKASTRTTIDYEAINFDHLVTSSSNKGTVEEIVFPDHLPR